MSQGEQEQAGPETAQEPEGTSQHEPGEVGDADLPDDLRPDEDNPLARHPGETHDDRDEIGGDHDGEAEQAPLTDAESDYGSDSARD